MHFCIVPLLLSNRKKHTWANRKPGSVLDDHPSCTAIACSIQRLTLGRQRATALYDPFLVLLRMGFTRPSCLQNAGELLPHHFNLTTALPVSAECFCCTFPIVTYAGRYPASLPCGARTFLTDRPFAPPARLSSLLAKDIVPYCGPLVKWESHSSSENRAFS